MGDCDQILKKCECKKGYSGDDCSIKFVKKVAPIKKKRIVKPKPIVKKALVNKEIVYSIHGKIFRKTKDCKLNCNKHGMCLNDQCLCDQGYTGKTCEKVYKDILKAGFKFKDVVVYLGAIAGGGLVLAIIVGCFI